MGWNRGFTDLIRESRPSYWGNWSLNPTIKPGAVGQVDPDTGDFRLIEANPLGLRCTVNPVETEWKLASENVSRTEGEVSAKVLGKKGVVSGGGALEVKWGFSSENSIASEFSIVSESVLDGQDTLTHDDVLDRIAHAADALGMNNGGRISQGFGIITSTIDADSGVNIGARSEGSNFAIAGSANAVHAMLGSVEGKASYAKVTSASNVEQHIWPHRPGIVSTLPLPIAYTFTSFDGRSLLPDWTGHINALSLTLKNWPGATYIFDFYVEYDTPRGHVSFCRTVSGGLTQVVGDIPLDAVNLRVHASAKCGGDHYFNWASPKAQWPNGHRQIGAWGVWPGGSHAEEEE